MPAAKKKKTAPKKADRELVVSVLDALEEKLGFHIDSVSELLKVCPPAWAPALREVNAALRKARDEVADAANLAAAT
jgi:hypothetical protein